jgi:hypothetical protein
MSGSPRRRPSRVRRSSTWPAGRAARATGRRPDRAFRSSWPCAPWPTSSPSTSGARACPTQHPGAAGFDAPAAGVHPGRADVLFPRRIPERLGRLDQGRRGHDRLQHRTERRRHRRPATPPGRGEDRPLGHQLRLAPGAQRAQAARRPGEPRGPGQPGGPGPDGEAAGADRRPSAPGGRPAGRRPRRPRGDPRPAGPDAPRARQAGGATGPDDRSR